MLSVRNTGRLGPSDTANSDMFPILTHKTSVRLTASVWCTSYMINWTIFVPPCKIIWHDASTITTDSTTIDIGSNFVRPSHKQSHKLCSILPISARHHSSHYCASDYLILLSCQKEQNIMILVNPQTFQMCLKAVTKHAEIHLCDKSASLY